MPAGCPPGSSSRSASAPSRYRPAGSRSCLAPPAVLGELEEDVLERALGFTKLADVDAGLHQPAVDHGRLGGIDVEREAAVLDLDRRRAKLAEDGSGAIDRAGAQDQAPAAAQLVDGASATRCPLTITPTRSQV